MRSRIPAIAGKELMHIRRDPRTLFVALLMPIIMLLLYGYAIDMDLKQVRMGVMDNDRTPASRALVEKLMAGNTFVVTNILSKRADIDEGFLTNTFRCAVIIEPGYGREYAAGNHSKFQVIVDGSDVNSANVIANSISAVSQTISQERLQARFGSNMKPPVELRTQVRYNEELRSPVFVVPGLVALFLVMLCALLTSVAIVRERETGTLEQVMTTPVNPAEVVIGKVLPYLAIAVIDTVITLLIGHFVFGVPVRGSLFALTGYSLLYLMVALGMGLLISVSVRTQQVALMLALVVTLLPTLMLSGLIFPISSMPFPLQMMSKLVPATWFIQVVRGILLKGVNFFPIHTVVLFVMAIFLNAISVRKFRKLLRSGVSG